MNEPSPIEVNVTPPRRTRRGRKRLVFQPPRVAAAPVRALWESAPQEEKERAHRTCVAILSMWLGHSSRQEVASELSMPPLRVWQLSQQALSGMLAGLLKQPRGRGKGATTMQSSEERPRSVLLSQVSKLEAENRALKDLLEVLKNLPAARERPVQAPRRQRPPESRRGKRSEIRRGREAQGGTESAGEGPTAPR